MQELLQMMLHADETIFEVVHQYGPWIYLILFAIIFIETGLVVVTFFPGDALLFSAGMLATTGELQLIILLPLLILATLLGHTSNYWIARVIGDRFFRGFNSKSYAGITKARQYYEQYGGQAVLWSRFFPFMRSFIPFVSGLSGMPFRHFTLYNAIGGTIWILIYILAGYYFGHVPWVQENYGLIFSIMILFALLSLLAAIVRHLWKHYRERSE